MTASTPMSVLGLDGTRWTGIPPPPQAMGRVWGQFCRSDLIASICRILMREVCFLSLCLIELIVILSCIVLYYLGIVVLFSCCVARFRVI